MGHLKFYVLMFLALPAFADDCREQILAKVCHVDHTPNLIQLNKDPIAYFKKMDSLSCTKKSQEHGLKLQAMYDRLPEPSKKAFCFIKKIHIAPLETAGGMTHYTYSSKTSNRHPQISGFYLVLDEKRIESKETCSSGETRFLKNFASKDVKTTGKMSIKFEKDSEDCLLWHTLVHETGHMIDFANSITIWPNRLYNAIGTFNGLSWKLSLFDAEPVTAPEFVTQRWKMGTNPPPEVLVQFVSEFHQSDFASVYAMSDPLEDFAETLTYLYINDGTLYDFNGAAYPLTAREGFELKKNTVREFLQKPELNFDPTISPVYDESVFIEEH